MKQSQAAVEFLFIIGFAMLLLIPSLALFARFVQESSYTVTTSQVNKIGNVMLSTAIQAYHGTNGTIIVIDINFPKGVKNMTIIDNQQLVFITDIGGALSENAYYSEIPINGSFNESDYSDGLKKFKFTAVNAGSLVQIERIVK